MIRKITLVGICLFCVLQSIAQSGLRKANAEYERKNYMVAAEMYEEIFPKITDKDLITEVAYRVGECYRMVNDYNKANIWYKRAVDRRYRDDDVHFKYGMTLMMAGDYRTADRMFKNYLATRPSQEMIELTRRMIDACKFARESDAVDERYEIRNVQEINSRHSDFAPTIVYEKLIFTSSRLTRDSVTYSITGQGFENLYETYFNSETQLFESPTLLRGSINSRVNNGTLVYDYNRKIGYFMQCNGLQGDEQNCNIFYSNYNDQDNSWGRPQIFQYNSTQYSSGHPAITPDGNTLYFVSNRPDGLGGTDIWKSTRTHADNWSEPVNLGTPINTILNENFPYVFDNSGIYFSSNGHIGYGGLDIYYSERLNDTTYGEPQNLMAPINSSADDFGFVFMNARSGLFSSNRQGGVGSDDLYYFSAKGFIIKAEGSVVDGETGNPIVNAIVVLTDHLGVADSVTTDEEGKYRFNMLKQDMGYYMVSVKDDYLNPQRKNFTTEGIQEDFIISSATGYDLDFRLTRIVEGKEYEIKNIYYDLDRYSLRPESIVELNNVVQILNNNPDIYIQINSHTDTRASHDYNIVLSRNRAKSVVDYLISQGIDTARLTWQGWGKTRLAIPNAQTEDEHQANRRTTFTIVNFEQLHLGEKAEFHLQAVSRIQKQQSHIAASADQKKEGVYFRLQVAATRSACSPQAFSKITQQFPFIETYCTQYPDGFYRYTVGYYMFLEQAEAMKTKIDSLGFSSFIVAFKDGVRIPVQQAIRELQKESDN